jgi:type VI secretion system (T6SS) effector TldE1-like protein
MTHLAADSWQGAGFDRAFMVKAAAAVVSAAAIAGLWTWLAEPADPAAEPAPPAQQMLEPTPGLGTRPVHFVQSLSLTADFEDARQPGATSLAAAFQQEQIRQAIIQQARTQLALAMQAQIEQSTVAETATTDTAATSPVKVPLPRSRPPESQLVASAAAYSVAQSGADGSASDIRSLLQKLASLLPSNITLASATPDGGVYGNGQDLTPPLAGYDRQTAVYDISARTVYMPDGSRLEAHSGFGSLLDDPAHINEHNRGATPPHVYDLALREKSFHGVQALRMIPVGDGELFGRSGLLAHSYMLGPNGDSNGCVSFKDYDAFLKAFLNGDVKHLVVVTSLANPLATTAGKPKSVVRLSDAVRNANANARM